MKKLSDKDLLKALDQLPGWTKNNNALEKSFEFEDFRTAMSAMLRLSYEAEDMNHHPEWSNTYNRLTIRLSTHDTGGISKKDIELAERIERLLID